MRIKECRGEELAKIQTYNSKQATKPKENDMNNFKPTEFESIEIDAIWTDEIYPLIRKDAVFADLCALAIAPEHGPVDAASTLITPTSGALCGNWWHLER